MAKSERVTPVEASKLLSCRPQIVYGFIKHNRLSTYPNPSGKASLVELADVKALLAGVHHHREKGPDGKPVKKVAAGVSRGTILSYHGQVRGSPRSKPHRVVAVTEVIVGDDGAPSLVYAGRDGESAAVVYEVENLADRIARGICRIEPPSSILGVLMYHWIHSEAPELAASLQLWCEANAVDFQELQEKVKEKERES
jgi:hypothetical protein